MSRPTCLSKAIVICVCVSDSTLVCVCVCASLSGHRGRQQQPQPLDIQREEIKVQHLTLVSFFRIKKIINNNVPEQHSGQTGEEYEQKVIGLSCVCVFVCVCVCVCMCDILAVRRRDKWEPKP